jgi:uncharacterized protein with HEPN domain
MSYNRDLDSVEDIVKSIRFVTSYAETVTEDQFSVDHAVQNVILREVTIIGEAARRLSRSFLEEHPEIPVADMISMRNALVHDYDDIRLPWVWATVKNDLPGLLATLEHLYRDSR